MFRRSAYHVIVYGLGAMVLGLSAPGSATAQGIVERAANRARSTAVGKGINRVSTELQLLDATFFDLEDQGLATVQVGELTFGVSGVDVKNNEGVRLHVYLYNPTTTRTPTVPVPDGEQFVLVDQGGRKLELVSAIEVENYPKGATEITVPALERITLYLLYQLPKKAATRATLKVGTLGVISNLPIHTTAYTGAANIWSPP